MNKIWTSNYFPLMQDFLFFCLFVCMYAFLFFSLFFLLICYVILLIHRSQFPNDKKIQNCPRSLFFSLRTGKKGNNANKEKKNNVCMFVEKKKDNILCVFFSLCVSKWIYVNVPLFLFLFCFFIISFVVLVTKRINDIPNWLIQT